MIKEVLNEGSKDCTAECLDFIPLGKYPWRRHCATISVVIVAGRFCKLTSTDMSFRRHHPRR